VELVLTESIGAIVRWLHVIAGIAWIGSSFYFIHLDLSLRPRPELPSGVKGEAWQVHGGGFYHMMKYLVAPAQLPDHLTWFKWEAYTTWLSGFALLVLVYYLGADLFLIDKSVLDLTATQAALIAFLSLVVSWLAYEALCRSPLGRHEVALAVVGYVFLVALTFAFTRVFSGRGAYTQIGALVGTIMVANVFVIIIPYQKKSVAALLVGKEPDPFWGQIGKQRSVHNNYLTLPVVFLMLSNHYPLFFATRYNWLIFAIVLLIGFLIRHFYNLRHAGLPNPWWTWAAAAIGMAAIAFLSWAGTRSAGAAVSSGAGRSLMTATTSVPTWRPSRSAEPRVIIDTSSWSPIRSRTSAMTPSIVSETTRPRSWLRALMSRPAATAAGRPRSWSRSCRSNSHLRPFRRPGSRPARASAWMRLTLRWSRSAA